MSNTNRQRSDNQAKTIFQFCYEMIHIGKEIEKRVRELRIPIVEFSTKINSSKQNVYDLFKRESVDTNQLFTISQELNFDFFALLSRALKSSDLAMVSEPIVEYKKTLSSEMASDLYERQKQDLRIMLMINSIFLYSKNTVVVRLFNGDKLTGMLWDIDTTNPLELKAFYNNKILIAFGLILAETEKKQGDIKSQMAIIGTDEFRERYVKRIMIQEVESIMLFEADNNISLN